MSEQHSRRRFMQETAVFTAAGMGAVAPGLMAQAADNKRETAAQTQAEKDAALFKDSIRIGTLVKGEDNPPEYIRQIVDHGFESFCIYFWHEVPDKETLLVMADKIHEVLAGRDAVISSLSVYGNPLGTTPEDEHVRGAWKRLIDAAPHFGCDIVSGFTGRVEEESIDKNIPRFKEVFEPLVKHAGDSGVRIAFENCPMGGNWSRGKWNIAHNPVAWELMFDALPQENMGLEWEPAHQLVQLIDPLPQLRKWAPKIFHLHGKDTMVQWDVIRECGIGWGKKYAHHRSPGFGDTNWVDVISILREHNFKGCIDIEGWHDPVYQGKLEMTGQVYSLNYLKQCRTVFVPNPTL
ncbi:MAG: sugar phosphate isomerase/epimerase family protein [Candidatus Hydrogenedentales bacterium]|jgi:sugar phosphate isomerase/epimerase